MATCLKTNAAMKTLRRVATFFCLALVSVCAACGFLADYHVGGPYRLVGVDLREDISLCISKSKSFCAGDRLPGPTVYAAGINARYVAFARHPRTEKAFNRAITEYYYIIRTPNEMRGVTPETLKGPFGQARFDEEKQRLGLPEFSVVLRDLE